MLISSYHFYFSSSFCSLYWFSFFRESMGWSITFKSMAVICMLRYSVFLKNQSHHFIATPHFPISTLNSILNGVFLVLRVRHAHSVTRPITSCLLRSLAGGFVQSARVKIRDSIVVESTDLVVWPGENYLTSLSLHVHICNSRVTIYNIETTYGRHLEEHLAQSK